MRVLIGCESSGVVRDAFLAAGYDAWSCDLLPHDSGSNERHFQIDILTCLDSDSDWDLIIMHPPCTYLASSGLHWNKRVEGRAAKTEAALEFVDALIDRMHLYDIPQWAIENPVGCISTHFRKPDQYVQPFDFGNDASKKTGLWLHNLPLLKPTQYVEPRMIDGRPRWANQTDSGQNRLGPSADRWKKRSRTFDGIAKAMVQQWGVF